MDSVLFSHIKQLCEERNVTITKLEADCGLGNGSIKKWQSRSTPSADKVKKIAQYFNVSTDYLLGITDIPTPMTEYLHDQDIISLQRARSKMSSEERDRMMQLIKLGFKHAFNDDAKDN